MSGAAAFQNRQQPTGYSECICCSLGYHSINRLQVILILAPDSLAICVRTLIKCSHRLICRSNLNLHVVSP